MHAFGLAHQSTLCVDANSAKNISKYIVKWVYLLYTTQECKIYLLYTHDGKSWEHNY